MRPALGLEVQALESKEKIWQTEETILPVGQDYKYYVFSSLALWFRTPPRTRAFFARFKKIQGPKKSKNLPSKKLRGHFEQKNSVCWSQLEISTKN